MAAQTSLFVGPGRKPRRPVFLRRGSYNAEPSHIELICRNIHLSLCVRTGPTQTGLYSHRRWLEAGNFGLRNKRNRTIRVAKTKALISFAVTAKLICPFVFAYADCWYSHAATQFYRLKVKPHVSFIYISM